MTHIPAAPSGVTKDFRLFFSYMPWSSLDLLLIGAYSVHRISTIHQPNAQKICEWLVDLDHSPARKNPNDYILCGWLNLKID